MLSRDSLRTTEDRLVVLQLLTTVAETYGITDVRTLGGHKIWHFAGTLRLANGKHREIVNVRLDRRAIGAETSALVRYMRDQIARQVAAAYEKHSDDWDIIEEKIQGNHAGG